MKITNRLRGTQVQPDYEMLRSALIAAQAATATGRAAIRDSVGGDPFAALNALFSSAEAAGVDASALANSFSRNPPAAGDAS